MLKCGLCPQDKKSGMLPLVFFFGFYFYFYFLILIFTDWLTNWQVALLTSCPHPCAMRKTNLRGMFWCEGLSQVHDMKDSFIANASQAWSAWSLLCCQCVAGTNVRCVNRGHCQTDQDWSKDCFRQMTLSTRPRHVLVCTAIWPDLTERVKVELWPKTDHWPAWLDDQWCAVLV